MLRKGTTIAVMKATKVSTEDIPYDPLGLGRDRDGTHIRSAHPGTCPPSKPYTGTYDHVAPLLTDISGHISVSDRTALQDTLIEYADVFSSGPDDIGLTDRVEHTIDTGDNRPIRLPPRRLPIAKQQCEADEVEKMLKKVLLNRAPVLGLARWS